MYRSRKKILLVAGTSVVVLSGFGIGAWAIVNSSNAVPRDDVISSRLLGSTAYCGDTAFVYGQMSVNDWMLYNMPKVAVITKSSQNPDTSLDINFYANGFVFETANQLSQSDLDNPTNKNKHLYKVVYDWKTGYQEVWTSGRGDSQPIVLASSTISSFGIKNKYEWSTDEQTINLSGDSTNGFTHQSPNKTTLNFSKITSTDTSYKASIHSNTNYNTWNREVGIKYNSGTENQKSELPNQVTFKYTSDSLSKNSDYLEQIYTKGNTKTDENVNFGYFNLTYKYSNTDVTTQKDLLKKIGYEKSNDHTIKSNLSSGFEFPYIPVSIKLFN